MKKRSPSSLLHHRPFWRLFAACLLVVWLAPTPGHSQQSLTIAAVVNDEIISVYDLAQRISLVVTFSNLPDTQQTRQRIAPEVLRRLITEKIRLQEAERLKITVPEEDIEASISGIESSNKMPPGGLNEFLKSRSIDRQTLEDQIRAELAWVKVVNSVFRGLVNVSEQEIEDELAKQRSRTGSTEYLASEIFLAYDEKPKSVVLDAAKQIHDQLRAGASWPQMAQNFSESASAQKGGDLGWDFADNLDPAVAARLRTMTAGQVSEPIATDDGVFIILLRDTRVSKGLQTEPVETKISLYQLHLSIPPGTDAATAAAITSRAQQIAAGAADCTALAEAAKTQGSSLSGALGTVDESRLNEQVRNLVGGVAVNQASQPMRTDNGVIVMMVCSREGAGGEDPIAKAREDISISLLNEKLNNLAQQHEAKLRRQAFIDVRL